MFPLVRRRQSYILIIVALVALGACAPLAKVTETKPKLGAPHGTIPELRSTEQAIAEGQKLERSDPSRAVGFYLSGVEAATKELGRAPKDSLAVRDYDFALSGVFTVIRDSRLDPWTRPLHVPAPGGGEYVLTHRPHLTVFGSHKITI